MATRILFLALMFLAGAAQAGVITQSQRFALTSLPAQSADSGVLWMFDAFDSSLGTLESVDIAISGRISGDVSFRPSDAGGSGPIFYELSIVQLFEPLGFTFAPEALYTGISSVAVVLPVDVNYTHTFTIDATGIAPVATTASASPGGSYTSPIFTFSRLDYFEAAVPAQIGIQPRAIVSSRFTGASMEGTLDSIGSITVVYNFTGEAVAVSEPGTALLLASSLACLAFVGRRHRRRVA